jgi:hypothetical protein
VKPDIATPADRALDVALDRARQASQGATSGRREP